MATELKKLEAWKRRVRQLVAEGKSATVAVREAICEDVPRYVEVLKECNFTDKQIVNSLLTHTSAHKGKKR